MLSVVMAVFNGAATVARTIDSVLAQTEPDFEFVIVDDGSTDSTPAIISSCDDARIRVITQTNQGLTNALIAGCTAARADVIARQDCGDVSMPQRFARQLEAIRSGAVLASCFARTIGPGGEHLYDATADGGAIRESLLHDDVDHIRALPHHGTAMFRRDAYVAAGGYRPQFRYAQDVDLWIRLAARGPIVVVDEVLYEAAFEVTAISANRRSDQIELARIAIALRDGGDASLLDDAAAIGGRARPRRRSDDARALYFIAGCLRRNGDKRYRRYARAALRHDPLNLRAWAMLVR